ncbi:replication/maintenance protein RepL [Campylobacter sp. MOP7]|uniref:replication/maintenance protein RepL n=1 Tax=Campylobacter TaxID=194 RepID=UPI001476208C|nr:MULTISPECIES: replication/maintenance protein RepL [unclassified Campylobacter]
MNSLEREIFGTLIGEKKFEIIEFFIQNLDENGLINFTIAEICNATNSSKPTVIETIKLLENRKIFKRVKNGVYAFKNLKFNDF